MEDTNWSVSDVFIIEERCVAFRIERDGRREFYSAIVVHFLKAFHACVERALTSARETHHGNSTGIDARLLGKDVQSPIAINHLYQPPQLSLIVAHAG